MYQDVTLRFFQLVRNEMYPEESVLFSKFSGSNTEKLTTFEWQRYLKWLDCFSSNMAENNQSKGKENFYFDR